MQNNGMEYLQTRLMFGMVPGLDSTRRICEALGNPERKFRSIHVVGTNGKGSTSFYLAGVLQAHGLKAGLYTSPHLVSLRERIRVDDEPISDADLDRLLLQVKGAAESVSSSLVALGMPALEPTFFEVLTVAAFLYYAEKGVDVAVLEAGMGGRLDSTAVAGGEMAVVTGIGLEHTEVLGATESAILREKMAVVGDAAGDGEGKTFVLGGLGPDLLGEAREYAAFLGASVVVPGVRSDVNLPNLGRHYVENASLSLKAAELFLNAPDGAGERFDDALSVKMLATRSWAGRMQALAGPDGTVKVILDGAHNSHAVRRLVQALDEYYPGQKFHCLFGALKDKDLHEMLRLMMPFVSEWHVTRTPYPRFRELDDLRSEIEGLGGCVSGAQELSRDYVQGVLGASEGPVLITGSLYMVGSVVQILKDDFVGLKFFRNLDPSANETH
ncbi:MAG: bifunctional folylpolyglutamate synthase/dihydrofolate synthase [Fibrobacter sp.]|nr:bifunctional folylpolyglutamate synthase/dihydrofolate synthase [Fibrobacter sp.]